MSIPIRPSEATLIEVRQALQRIEHNRRLVKKNNFSATVDPAGSNSSGTISGSTDDESLGYEVGSFWYNQSTNVLFINEDATKDAAIWQSVTGTTTGIAGNAYETIEDDAAATISSTSATETLQVLGGTGITTAVLAGSPDKITITNSDPGGGATSITQDFLPVGTGSGIVDSAWFIDRVGGGADDALHAKGDLVFDDNDLLKWVPAGSNTFQMGWIPAATHAASQDGYFAIRMDSGSDAATGIISIVDDDNWADANTYPDRSTNPSTDVRGDPTLRIHAAGNTPIAQQFIDFRHNSADAHINWMTGSLKLQRADSSQGLVEIDGSLEMDPDGGVTSAEYIEYPIGLDSTRPTAATARMRYNAENFAVGGEDLGFEGYLGSIAAWHQFVMLADDDAAISGNIMQGGGNQIITDSGIAAGDIVTSAAAITDNVIPMGTGSGIEDSLITLDATGASIVDGLVDVTMTGELTFTAGKTIKVGATNVVTLDSTSKITSNVEHFFDGDIDMASGSSIQVSNADMLTFNGTASITSKPLSLIAGADITLNGGDLNTGSGEIIFTKKASIVSTPVAGFGYLWVKNTAPSTLIFTDDTGVDTTLGAGGGGGAPTDATYIVQTANASLSAEQALGALATGIMKSTTTTGVVSIAVAGTDYAAAVDDLSDADTTTSVPALNEVLKWDGSNWVPGTAGDTTEFSFSIDSFSDGISDTSQLIGSGTWKAVGAISFTATYSNAPGGMTAEVAQSGATTAWAGNLSMTPVTGPETNTELVDYPSSATGTITFTLSQSADGTTDTEQVSFSNTMRYGTNANGIGNQTEANVEAMTEVGGPNESRSQTISNIATDAGNEVSFSYADRLSDVAQVRINTGNGGFVTASFASSATTLAPTIQTTNLTAITNSASFTEAFVAITSRLTDLTNGTNDFQLLTSSTAQNYIFWGEHTVDSGADDAQNYTEAMVEGNIATEPGQTASSTMSSRSMTVNATAGQYTYIAYPSRMGALTSIVIGGFESIGDFWWDAGSGTELAITNDGGYQENYYVYVSKNPGFTDPTTMLVTI